jgi:hypothetical protein
VEINKDLPLDVKNYHPKPHKKRQIVIGNTSTTGMGHFDLWKAKFNGKFKGTSPYTIGLDGTIYEHYNPKYHSEILNIEKYDQHIIPILLENEGWLMKDYKNNVHLNWCGDIYNRDADIFETKWRTKMRWAPYTDDQLKSLIDLCDNLIEGFKIKRLVCNHNTKILDISELDGIYYRSNYSTNYLDVSPAFNFKEFKTNIEK